MLSLVFIIELLRVSYASFILLLQVPFWCCFEYVHSVLQAEFLMLSQASSPSRGTLFCYEMMYPVLSVIIAVVVVILQYSLQFINSHQVTSLQLIGTGYGVFHFLTDSLVLIVIHDNCGYHSYSSSLFSNPSFNYDSRVPSSLLNRE